MANYFSGYIRRKRAGRLDNRSGLTNPRPENYPIPYAPYIQSGGQIEKVPIMLFSIRWLYDISYASDVVRTILRTITGETFKNGYDVRERFKSKCLECDREFEEDIDICPYDGGITRAPDYDEYKKLKEFTITSNQFGDDFMDVLKQIDNDVNVVDNGYIYLEKDYFYGENGKMVGATVKRLLRLAPERMRLIMTAHGGGRGENGEYFYFCPIHRKRLTIIPEYEGDMLIERHEAPSCPDCGGDMILAWYGAREEEEPVYFGQEEVYHMKRWSHSEGYGVPPMYSIYLKVLSLLKMDRFILDAYHLQRSPQGLLILKGREENVRKEWMWLMQKARENPNMIYPLILEGEEDTKRVIEYQEFSLKPVDFQWVDSRKEYRETIGAVYGVQPIFVEGATEGGLANEGLQITATSQTINEQQRVWNHFLEWLSKMLGARDYILVLHGNELEDELKKLDIAGRRLELAKEIIGFGKYDIRLKRDGRGILDFDYVKKSDDDVPSTGDEAEESNNSQEEEPEPDEEGNGAEAGAEPNIGNKVNEQGLKG